MTIDILFVLLLLVLAITSFLLERIPPREKVSVIPAFLDLAREGRLGASLRDNRDLGTRHGLAAG